MNRQIEGKYPEPTRERVFQAVKQTGYAPSRAAQKLVVKKSKEVGVVLTRTFENPFFARLTHEIQQQLGRRGYRVQLHVTGKDLFLLTRFPVELLGDHVDGVVLGPVYESDREHLDALKAFEEAGIPVTIFGGPCGTPHTEFLWPHDAAARMAADMLLDRGHRRIAFLGSGVGSAKRRDGKVSGMLSQIEAHGGALERVPHADTGDYEDFYQTAASFCRSWRSTPPAQRATAVICLNDQLAVSLYAACSDLNITIPGDLSVVGFDNIPESVVLRPALSTIDFRAADQVQRIVDLMVCRIEGRDPSGSAVAAEPIALVRDSVRPIRGDQSASLHAPAPADGRGV